MKRLRLIKALSITIIGGGLLTSAPLIVVSCSCSNKNVIIDESHLKFSDDNTTVEGFYGKYDTSWGAELIIPTWHNKTNVTTIGGFAFFDCTGIATVTFPNTLTHIERGSFDGCVNLSTITFPNSLENIGINAFYDCKFVSIALRQLKTVSTPTYYLIGPDGKQITDSKQHDNAFIINASNFDHTGNSNTIKAACSSVAGVGVIVNQGGIATNNLTIPQTFNGEAINGIDYGAFYGCSGITNIALPISINTIRSSAFYGCTSLKEMVFPGALSSIEDAAFFNCVGIRSYKFADSQTATETDFTIGSNAFKGCAPMGTVSGGGQNTQAILVEMKNKAAGDMDGWQWA